jgi:TonB family protein
MKYALVLLVAAGLPGAAFAGDTVSGAAPALQPGYGWCGPFYPLSAFKDQLRGETKLSYRIAADGSVHEIAVAASSGNEELDNAAATCAGTWRYGLVNDSRPADMPWQTNIAWFPPRPHFCPGKGVDANGVTGLAFTISSDGHVTDAKVVRPSGSAALDEAALRCATQWRYKAAVDNGKRVSVSWDVDVQWGALSPPVLIGGAAICSPPSVPAHDTRTQVAFRLAGGVMIDLKLMLSSGDEALDRAALACVAKRQYRETVSRDMLSGFVQTVTIEWKGEASGKPGAKPT